MQIVAVCVSRERTRIPRNMLYVNLVNPRPAPPRMTVERVRFVAEERNKAVKKAIEQYPHLTHVFMIDSYYLDNPQNDHLWSEFAEYYLPRFNNAILGAACYKLHDIFLLAAPLTFFVEVWSSPEGVDSTMVPTKSRGTINVQAVGSIYIFPRQVWEQNPYTARDDYFLPEHIDLCRNSKIPVWLSFTHKFYAPPLKYSTWKKLRVTAGYLRRKYVYA